MFCLLSHGSRRRRCSQLDVSIGPLDCGRCLNSSSLSLWQSSFIPRHARSCCSTQEGGNIWSLLACTQNYHSPTSVQVKPDVCGRGPAGPRVHSCLLSMSRVWPSALFKWSQNAAAPWIQSRYLRVYSDRARCGTDVSQRKCNLGLDFEDGLINNNNNYM